VDAGRMVGARELASLWHGFRANEPVDLRWDRINFEAGTLVVAMPRSAHSDDALPRLPQSVSRGR
jgi:hypothetical protein